MLLGPVIPLKGRRSWMALSSRGQVASSDLAEYELTVSTLSVGNSFVHMLRQHHSVLPRIVQRTDIVDHTSDLEDARRCEHAYKACARNLGSVTKELRFHIKGVLFAAICFDASLRAQIVAGLHIVSESETPAEV